MQDLQELPRLRDSLSYLYIEHAIVERDASAIKVLNKAGRLNVPAAALCVLMLGPGTSITHAAVKILAEIGCSIVWTGEEGIRLYAQGVGETRRAYRFLRQAEMVCDNAQRKQVVMNMYRKRFGEDFDLSLDLAQIRGREGARVRKAYQQASQQYGISWAGRRYDMQHWGRSDPINRSLSAANALLNGICHAAIVSGGYSPALGFIHTGRQLSFVYDIADLYKTEITIPIAFQAVAESKEHLDSRVRVACRQKFKEMRLLEHLLPDIDQVLGIHADPEPSEEWVDASEENPYPLWKELMAGAEVEG